MMAIKMRGRKVHFALTCWIMLSLILLPGGEGKTQAFEGDIIPVIQVGDLAIGVPFEDVKGIEDAGAVNVLYGDYGGMQADTSQFWHQDQGDIDDNLEIDDVFGSALATGDFDNDGFDDLAIGVPWESVEGEPFAGTVNVLYGSPVGLRVQANQLWYQTLLGNCQSDENDLFGSALAAGDINGDGNDDLVVGAPGELLQQSAQGAVNILYGSSQGLSAANTKLIDISNWAAPQANEYFGAALAIDDFHNDGYADLVIGIPGRDYEGKVDVGMVLVLEGRWFGITETSAYQFWFQGRTDVEGLAEADDYFGSSLATGDFDADGHIDLAIGVYREDVEETEDAGTVNVLYGSADGLDVIGNQLWHQDKSGVEGVAGFEDLFAYSLAAGDFNQDGADDLAVGVPGDDVGGAVDAGVVNLLYGSNAGLTSDGDQLWQQNSTGILETAETSDYFGGALAAGDLNGDGIDDLVIGVPQESGPGKTNAGVVHILYGNSKGLTRSNNQLWYQDQSGLEGLFEGGDQFGYALAIGNFNGDDQVLRTQYLAYVRR